MLLEFLISVLFILLIYTLSLQRKSPGFPPGPFTLPIFGNLLQLGVEPYKGLMKMRKTYGDIIGIDLGTRRAVSINFYELLKEAYNLPVFNGRPPMDHFAEPETGIFRGLVFSNGHTWAEQRKFAFTYIQSGLRNGRTMESLVNEEVAEVIENLTKISGQSISTQHVFNIPTVNTLWAIVAGNTYALDDQDFLKMAKHVEGIFTVAVQGVLTFFPKFSKAFPRLSGFQRIRDHVKAINEFMQNIVDEHKSTYIEGIERDFVDAYLHKMKTTTDPNSSFFEKTGEINLVHTMSGLFFGGTASAATTLRWLIFLMAHYPEVQKKLIRSIKLTLDQGAMTSLKDRRSLPYVEAVIEEVLRFSAMAPMGLFHETLEDVEFHGYHIPKGTVIVGNHYCVLHDSEVWGDPENFRPERFLIKNGTTTTATRGSFVPFGIGRRSCPGESFSRDELFLFTTGIFQNFRVEFDPSLPTPPLKGILGHVMTPVDHQIIFHKLTSN